MRDPHIKELAEHLRLAIEGAGFELARGRGPQRTTRFERRREGFTDRIDLNWDKYGRPRFKLLLMRKILDSAEEEDSSVKPKSGTIVRYTVCWLRPRRGLTTASWYRLDKPWPAAWFSSEKYYKIGDLMEEFKSHLPEALAWLDSEKAGPHLRSVDLTLRFK